MKFELILNAIWPVIATVENKQLLDLFYTDFLTRCDLGSCLQFYQSTFINVNLWLAKLQLATIKYLAYVLEKNHYNTQRT